MNHVKQSLIAIIGAMTWLMLGPGTALANPMSPAEELRSDILIISGFVIIVFVPISIVIIRCIKRRQKDE
ncbi:MAG: hypothetical protein ACM3MK_03710 [Chitinophagales bacterium]